MPCPICGANCKCKKRGPGGICCSCHSHKVNGKRIVRDTPEMRQWLERHGYETPQEAKAVPVEEPSLW